MDNYYPLGVAVGITALKLLILGIMSFVCIVFRTLP